MNLEEKKIDETKTLEESSGADVELDPETMEKYAKKTERMIGR